MNKEINEYKLIDCDDDAIYIAKSKQDVLDYWYENYGSPLDLIHMSDEEFLEELVVMDLNSERVNSVRYFLVDEDTGGGESTHHIGISIKKLLKSVRYNVNLFFGIVVN